MADKTVTSKTLSIELDTGQTKKTEITDSRGRGTGKFRRCLILYSAVEGL